MLIEDRALPSPPALAIVCELIVDNLATRIAKEFPSSLLNHGGESDRVIGQIAMMTNSSGAAPFWAGELALAVRLKRKDDSICTNILTARATAEDDTNRGVVD